MEVGDLIGNVNASTMRTIALAEISKLKNGESWIWPESDYGKAEILFRHGTYFLFEIPTYGGDPILWDHYTKHNLDKLIEAVESWT